MLSNDIRLQELGAKAMNGTMTDEELAELVQLSTQKKKSREEREAVVAGLRETLESKSITIHELFSAAEIAAAMPRGGVAQRRVVRPRPARLPGASTWVRQKAGLVLVEVKQPGFNGLPSRYCKGQPFAAYVSKGFKLLDDGQLEANLERCYTDEGREYFATEAGKIELAKLIAFIRTHQRRPAE